MRKFLAFLVVAALVAAPLFAQSRIQREKVLTTAPEQLVSLAWNDVLQSPAVQIGQQIFVGYIDLGMGDTGECVKVYVLEAGDPIPDEAESFLGVVVGQGNQRSYLWRGPVQPQGSCIGATPNPGGGNGGGNGGGKP